MTGSYNLSCYSGILFSNNTQYTLTGMTISGSISTTSTTNYSNFGINNQAEISGSFFSIRPLSDLDLFLLDYKLPDFAKSYIVFKESNPNATSKEKFMAAMKIGYAMAKLKTDDLKEVGYNGVFNSSQPLNTYSMGYSTGLVLIITGNNLLSILKTTP